MDLHAARTVTSPTSLAELSPFGRRVLASRGLTDPEGIRAFLSPRLADLTLPDTMADRGVAAERLAHAVRRGEPVAVYGDYDVDGITAAALVTRALKALGGVVTAYVASRFEGGYGLSDAALERVLASRPAVLVTCDCGTSDHPRLERARAAGVDVIVVDHHKVPEEALPALAFLNPHRPGCGFPYKGLASVGLALSIAAAVRGALGKALDVRAYLDLVALGTVADVAPLTGDNRILTRAGLQRIGEGLGCPGVRALVREARLRHAPSARDVGFSLAPLMNAPGRLGSPRPTLELLLSEDDASASRLAAELAEANTRRRAISQDMITSALAQVREVYGTSIPAGVVVAADGWHQGMGGIVAGRLTDRLGAAVAVVAFEGAFGVGSVRAPRGVRVYDAVAACRDVLQGFGGHDGAAGLKVHREHLEAFRARFATAPGGTEGAAVAAPAPDTELTEDDLGSEHLARDLRCLEPCGEANPEPLVTLIDAKLTDDRVVGDVHLRLRLGVGRRSLPGFYRDGVSARSDGLVPPRGARVSVLGTLKPDPWSGPEAVQLEVVSVKREG
ncbi:MAG: single-stranded-DNA-specific exonuclease RecJ [Deltaproteobacteria bacterium]|nr:single-stranded-DNA-specific exonuclease RecJ [Deltaproteobacteria bacterium]